MSLPNDESNKRRRLTEALAAANVNSAASFQGALNHNSLHGQSQPSAYHTQAQADVARLNLLLGGAGTQSAAASAPQNACFTNTSTASAGGGGNSNQDLMAALLGLNAPPQPQPEPPRSSLDLELARLLNGGGQPAQRLPAVQPANPLFSLLSGPTPAAATNESILSLLGNPGGLAPARRAVTQSMLHQVSHANTSPGGGALDLQALLGLGNVQEPAAAPPAATNLSTDQLVQALTQSVTPASNNCSTDQLVRALTGVPAAPSANPSVEELLLKMQQQQGQPIAAAAAPQNSATSNANLLQHLQLLQQASPSSNINDLLKQLEQLQGANKPTTAAASTNPLSQLALLQQQIQGPQANSTQPESLASVSAYNKRAALPSLAGIRPALMALAKRPKPQQPSTSGSTKKATGKRKAAPAAAAAAPLPLRRAPVGLTGHPPAQLYMACDEERLSAYHVLARKQIEFFEASEEDTSTNARGRNRPIVLGQVGIRCRHCASLPPRRRQRAAMYYPFKLDLLYQASQTLANVHLCEQCQHIPDEIRAELVRLRGEKTTALVGKKYWADGARIRGVYESEDGMRFEPPKKNEEGGDASAAKKAALDP